MRRSVGLPLVLDASAVLALLRGEDGADEVVRLLSIAEKDADGRSGLLSAVNAVEVRQVATPAAVGRLLKSDSPIGVESFTAQQATRAAELREPTRHLGLSLADRACLALGLDTQYMVVTADHAWDDLRLGVTIRNVRPRP